LGQQGDKQRALEELRTAIQLSPQDADSHYDLGKMELESGDTTAAIPELEAAARLLPNSEKFHQELADGYTAAHRPADAQKEMETYNLLRAREPSSTSLHQAAAPKQ
jgi:Flp pilus assembly protein TadD